ncbi:OsmC family protein [Nonlabens sp.]|uniref:OsmC family protein n=1 Tax=Nonlabens sp. TaxID=1888209 RepID=UPI003F69F36D
MKKEFIFKVSTKWQQGQFENAKTHISTINGKNDLLVSAAREFKGEPHNYNPEDLLLSALSSCHMMSYFYVCQQNGVEIERYIDNTTGILELKSDSSGAFQKVTLNPIVFLKDTSKNELALSLHKKAHELCFIANSVSFPIEIKASISS